ncbi:MAG: GatB/YqeY domain-containing protein, partial [Chloroflexi bacterium]
MTLLERLTADLKESLRQGDKLRSSVIRLAKAAIHNAEIAKGRPLEEGEVLEVLSRQVKQRRESITEFEKAGREDLLSKEKAELSILLEYLPQQLSREEIAAAVRQV